MHIYKINSYNNSYIRIYTNLCYTSLRGVFMQKLSIMSDEEIIKTIAKAYEQYRLQLELSEDEVSKLGGVSKDAIHRFKNGKNINIKNLIAILRGIGRVDALSSLFPPVETYSPLPNPKKKPKKRVSNKNKKQTNNTDFVWGEDP